MATVMGSEQTTRTWLWRLRDSLHRFFDSDVFYSFRRSPVTVLAFVTTVIFFVGAFAAPVLAPYNTNDVSTLNLMDAFRPPVWMEGGSSDYLLGTDEQGRDVLSAIMFGTQISLIVGFMSRPLWSVCQNPTGSVLVRLTRNEVSLAAPGQSS